MLHTGLTWVEMIHGQPTYPGCEPLVEPELVPPIHGDKIAKPLVSQLYCRTGQQQTDC